MSKGPNPLAKYSVSAADNKKLEGMVTSSVVPPHVFRTDDKSRAAVARTLENMQRLVSEDAKRNPEHFPSLQLNLNEVTELMYRKKAATDAMLSELLDKLSLPESPPLFAGRLKEKGGSNLKL